MIRRLALLTVGAPLALVRAPRGRQLLPPKKQGLHGRHRLEVDHQFKRQVGKHPSVFGFFHKWGGPTGFIYDSVERSGSRLMLHISTQDGYGTPEVITPREIARARATAT